MFAVGDKIVHPMHGAGIIGSIVDEIIDGQVHRYYVFEMSINGLVLKIPTVNSGKIGIRAVESKKTIDAILKKIPSLPTEMTNNWNQRYRENMDHIKSGNLLEVATVIKGLMCRDSLRGLSTGERKMLHSAKQILISEIVLAENAEYDAVEKQIDAAVMKGSADEDGKD